MYLLGYDIGSSSVKASLVDAESGRTVASDFYPRTEAEIIALCPGWAEQRPQQWWDCLKQATASVMATSKLDPRDIKAIGISYQMHGLVMLDKDMQPLRPAIIWCDSRGDANMPEELTSSALFNTYSLFNNKCVSHYSLQTVVTDAY